MTSKSSFFDLLKENFKRRTWTVALSALFFMFYFPIGTLLMSDMYLKSSHLIYIVKRGVRLVVKKVSILLPK